MVEEKLAALVHADRTSLFVVDEERKLLVKETAKDHAGKIEVPLYGESYISKCYQTQRVVNEYNLPESASKFGYEMKNMLCIPVVGNDGVIGVLQMLNKVDGECFSIFDERAATRFSTLLALTLQGGPARADPEKMVRSESQHLEKEKNRLLKQEISETVVKDLTTVVDADRGSLFLVDGDSDDLITIVAQGNEIPIRTPKDRGIVGQVARTGETLNIKNAYECKFFNPKNDKLTGYKTQSVLATPVKTQSGELLGVIQLLNKHKEPEKKDSSKGFTHFSREDEQLIDSFAMTFAMLLMR